jgi:hypothetical protein
VGIRLFVEVLQHAPLTLTHREKLLLAVLAEDANDDTRLTWSSVEDPKILRGAMVNRAQLYAVLKALIAKDTLKRISAGQRHGTAKYKILEMASQCQQIPDAEADFKGQQIPDTDPSQCQQIPDADAPLSVSENQKLTDSQCQGFPDLSVRESLTPTPLPLKRDTSPAPRATRTPAATDEEFAAFWAEYPRKAAKADAKKAYAAAVKAGATPAHLAAMAAKHRQHWTAEGRQPNYIPHPATWLRRESYDDELTTPQPAGPQQPAHQTYADRGIF